MKMVWSVELIYTGYSDDTFNGTLEECIEYCRKNAYSLDGNEARLAEVLLDDKGIVEFCFGYYHE